MNEYWDKRYQAEGRIWGESPSRTAFHALELFRAAGVNTILVPGPGYGRNTRLFSESGFKVTGIESSPAAFALAQKFDPHSRFYNASALDMPFRTEKFDAVCCINVLHLFRANDRKVLIKQCLERLNAKGLMYFAAFSEEDESCGKGQEIENNTFESKAGRPAHYFTESDLKAHFNAMKILETGIMEDPENHGAEGPHMHRLRYIYMRVE